MSVCAFVSSGNIRCQLTKQQHARYGWHMAWDSTGLPVLKMGGDFVPAPSDASSDGSA